MSAPSLVRTYAVPATLFVASVAGLALALVSEGLVDAFALLLVAAPCVAVVVVLLRRRSS